MISVKKIFPSVGDYLEALANPDGRFRLLDGVRPVMDCDRMPVFVSGTGRVTFEVTLPASSSALSLGPDVAVSAAGDSVGGGKYGLTCFTSALRASVAVLPTSPYGRVLPDELYVFNRDGVGDYYLVAIRPLDCSDGSVAEESAVVGSQGGELCEGRRVIVREGMFGYADQAGRIVVRPQYAWAGDFSEGRAAVCSSSDPGVDYMGLIDVEGVLVVPVEYDDLSWDGSRYAYVDQAGRHGCLDRLGRVVIPLEYDWVGEFDHGFAVVCRDGWYGYVDASGALVGEGLVYRDAVSVSGDGRAEVVLPDGTRSALCLF